MWEQSEIDGKTAKCEMYDDGEWDSSEPDATILSPTASHPAAAIWRHLKRPWKVNLIMAYEFQQRQKKGPRRENGTMGKWWKTEKTFFPFFAGFSLLSHVSWLHVSNRQHHGRLLVYKPFTCSTLGSPFAESVECAFITSCDWENFNGSRKSTAQEVFGDVPASEVWWRISDAMENFKAHYVEV